MSTEGVTGHFRKFMSSEQGRQMMVGMMRDMSLDLQGMIAAYYVERPDGTYAIRPELSDQMAEAMAAAPTPPAEAK